MNPIKNITFVKINKIRDMLIIKLILDLRNIYFVLI
jgi:hypothetical protein